MCWTFPNNSYPALGKTFFDASPLSLLPTTINWYYNCSNGFAYIRCIIQPKPYLNLNCSITLWFVFERL